MGEGATLGEIYPPDAFVRRNRAPHARGFEKRRERDARYCRAVDRWEDRLAALTEALAPAPVRPQVWRTIERRIARERVAFSGLLFWQLASGVLAAILLGLAIVLAC